MSSELHITRMFCRFSGIRTRLTVPALHPGCVINKATLIAVKTYYSLTIVNCFCVQQTLRRLELGQELFEIASLFYPPDRSSRNALPILGMTNETRELSQAVNVYGMLSYHGKRSSRWPELHI